MSTSTSTRPRTRSRGSYIPPRRGSRTSQSSEMPFPRGRFFRAAIVLLFAIAAICDQAYRPDLSRQREVLSSQVNEATDRMDRLKTEIGEVKAERGRIANQGVPADAKWRWDGEPYRSVEHCLNDYDRRIGYLETVLSQLLDQASEFSREIDQIDEGGGRRVPIANQILLRLRGVLKQ